MTAIARQHLAAESDKKFISKSVVTGQIVGPIKGNNLLFFSFLDSSLAWNYFFDLLADDYREPLDWLNIDEPNFLFRISSHEMLLVRKFIEIRQLFSQSQKVEFITGLWTLTIFSSIFFSFRNQIKTDVWSNLLMFHVQNVAVEFSSEQLIWILKCDKNAFKLF